LRADLRGQKFLLNVGPTDAEAGINDIRVVKRSAMPGDFIHGGFNPERGTIGAVRRHGFQDIGDADDARLQKDIRNLLALRISGTIHPFRDAAG